MPDADRLYQVSVSEALARLPGPDGARFVSVLRHGTLDVEIYAPEGHDPQTPHRRDELYVVIRGTGLFCHEGRRTSFEPGDVLFVPAGDDHRFEDFSDDFAVWVIFYGPDGGEAAGADAA